MDLREVGYDEGTLFFQQDNHPIHTANQIQRWFTSRRDVDPVDWPPNSPDVNPFQNLWAAVKRILRSNWAEQPPIWTPEELWDMTVKRSSLELQRYVANLDYHTVS
ncbi:hypothetical protein ANN_00845 [Periplaneta americana]|uniref:Tc1-like transposase DDE domain-containing protein n=1 Tax=Periplaneta americana TaxID=6978 RepID=A0ABQ8TUB5_PERAM|nr:hypothetical protein ANN_00845 [Periplaneta americana]